jgi:hypothetical protein
MQDVVVVPPDGREDIGVRAMSIAHHAIAIPALLLLCITSICNSSVLFSSSTKMFLSLDSSQLVQLAT